MKSTNILVVSTFYDNQVKDALMLFDNKLIKRIDNRL